MSLNEIFLAYDLARKAHSKQKRKTGEPYIIHPIAVAEIARKNGADDATICACLLHDVPEDTEVNLDTIKVRFGEEISFIVDGVTKLDNKDATFEKVEKYAESDKRVILVKLADRIDNTKGLAINAEVLEEMRKKYRISNPWYIDLGKLFKYDSLAKNLEDLTRRYCNVLS